MCICTYIADAVAIGRRHGARGRPPRGLGRPHREGHRRHRGARGRPVRGLGRPHREGHRRRRGAWGRPQRVPVKSLNYKEEIEMREILENQDLTGHLPCKVVFYQKN